MTLQHFIEKYDQKGSIILLEGKRKVAESDKPKLITLGCLLASRTTHMQFRRGNADGADQFFSEGVLSVDPERIHVITPYSGHRKKSNQSLYVINLDEINLAAEEEEEEVVLQSGTHKKMKKLVDQYVSGKRDPYSMKAAYIIRDTIRVIGTEAISAASFGIFYDDLANPRTGGTGHTMNVCLENGIPIIDQGSGFNGWRIDHCFL